jgi:GNAT superfamily N-acetyltransferase
MLSPAAPSTPPTEPAPRTAAVRWVPVRSLQPRHRGRILEHLLSLGERDRFLRFGYPATDARVRAYVEALDFERDEILGIFDRRLRLVATAHVAYDHRPGGERAPDLAEFAVSVLERGRGRGFGARLFDHAVMHARNRGVERLMIHALSENTAMLRIARNAGATVQRDGSESEAWLRLPPVDLGSRVEELVEAHAAELSYGLRRHARRWARVLRSVAEIRDRISSQGGIAGQ